MTSTDRFAADDSVNVFSEDDQYQEPPADANPHHRQVLVSEALLCSTIDSLARIDEFFRRYANPSVHNDLRTYAQAQGWHPITGPGAFLDAIAFRAHHLSHTITNDEETSTGPI
jgi:hypothetical protein